jgi:LPXTG-motif cell wall-anchored protein
MRPPSSRLILAAACCAVTAALPASIAQATSPGAALTISAGHKRALRHTPAARNKPVGRHTPAAAPAPRHTPAARHTQAPAVKRFTAEPARPAAHRAHRARRPHTATGLTGRVTAHVAGDPGVSIADFHFSPATTTIHVGDTITWSNGGPSSHTATASNGSFNTGILKKGQSASHTFTQPGTYAYVCQIHSFMHGTIVVLASTTSTTTTPASSTPTTTTPGSPTTPTPTATAAAAPTGPTLPNTGFDALGAMLAGLVLVGAGAGLRRTRPR